MSATLILTRAHKVFLTIGLAALLAGGSVAIVPSLLWGDHADYSHVVSIKDAREYQDPVLLEKAWALPVAALYHANIDYQRNVSLCGPTSLVNVLRSLHRVGEQATILEGTGISTVMGYLPGGVTLDQLARIAKQKVAREGHRVARSGPRGISRAAAPCERHITSLRHQFHARTVIRLGRRAPLADRRLPRRRRLGIGS